MDESVHQPLALLIWTLGGVAIPVMLLVPAISAVMDDVAIGGQACQKVPLGSKRAPGWVSVGDVGTRVTRLGQKVDSSSCAKRGTRACWTQRR